MSNWYDKTQVLSYNRLLNMIIGQRGAGKTYGFKVWCVRDFLQNNKQFVWVRRFKNELDTIESFFKDIKHEFKGHKMAVLRGKTQSLIKVDDKVAGYVVALSTSQKLKSTPYPNVDKIVFDEFLLTSNVMHYLENEVEVFLDLMSTVFRKRAVRGAYLIANNTNFNNPYFNYFNIKKFDGRFYLHKTNPQVLAEFYVNEDYAKEVEATAFGELIKETKYGDFNIHNKVLKGNDNFIGKKPSTATYLCAIKNNDNTLGFWFDANNGKVYVNQQYNPEALNVIYALTRDDHTPNTYLIEKRKYQHNFKILVMHYVEGCMYFENSKVKVLGEEIMSLIS